VEVAEVGRHRGDEPGQPHQRAAPPVERLAGEAGVQLGAVGGAAVVEQHHHAGVLRLLQPIGLDGQGGDLVGRGGGLDRHRSAAVDRHCDPCAHGRQVIRRNESCREGSGNNEGYVRSHGSTAVAEAVACTVVASGVPGRAPVKR
jgi:hypothetical protein